MGGGAPLQLEEEGLAIVLDEGDGIGLRRAGGSCEQGYGAPLESSRVVGDATRDSQQRGLERPRLLSGIGLYPMAKHCFPRFSPYCSRAYIPVQSKTPK